jgi:ribose transport system permease protein
MRAEMPPRRAPWRVPSRYALILALAAVFAFFSVATTTFLTPGNLLSIVVNNFALLAIVAMGMTLAIAGGGIDLSVGTSIDIASLVFVASISAHLNVAVALAGALLGGLAVGVFNAVLITGLRITPFLATLGTLFIGQSVQQLSTGGGQPIYLITGHLPAAFGFIGQGAVLGVPFTLIVVAAVAAMFAVVIGRSLFGRRVLALGAQPGVAWYSGLRVSRDTALVYVLSALACAVTGILLSCTVRAYVPLSGNAYLLNAIGATFIGTTFSPAGRPSVVGTLLGVLLLNIVANGLLLIGWNFYWQQVGTGVLIFLVLVVSFGGRHLAGVRRGRPAQNA